MIIQVSQNNNRTLTTVSNILQKFCLMTAMTFDDDDDDDDTS